MSPAPTCSSNTSTQRRSGAHTISPSNRIFSAARQPRSRATSWCSARPHRPRRSARIQLQPPGSTRRSSARTALAVRVSWKRTSPSSTSSRRRPLALSPAHNLQGLGRHQPPIRRRARHQPPSPRLDPRPDRRRGPATVSSRRTVATSVAGHPRRRRGAMTGFGAALRIARGHVPVTVASRATCALGRSADRAVTPSWYAFPR